MASSQVEFASSGSFGSVLRDHNRRDGCRESNARATQATLQKNLKNFVSNHYNSCISVSSDSVHSENNQNQNQNQISNADSWVSNVAKNNLGSLRFTSSSSHINREREEALGSPRNSRFLDQWAARKARQMVSTIEDEAQLLALPNSSSPAPSDASSEVSNLGASSLVQIWEKRLNQSKSSAVASPGRWSPTASATSSNENTISAEEQSKGSEAGESADERQVNEESFPDWESDRTAPNDQTCSAKAQNSGVAEIKRVRVRVVDIIKRLIATSKMQIPLSSHTEDNNRDQCTNNNTGSQRQETPEVSDHIVFSQVINSPRIRGRQAFKDLLMQMERDRHSELHSLADRKVVSMFTHRGRIQSLLRLKLLQRDAAAHDQSRQQSVASELNKQQEGSSIMHLRERFKTGVEQGITTQDESISVRSSRREIINKNITQFNNSANLDQLRGGIHTTEPMPQTSANCKEGEAQQSSSITWQGTRIVSEEVVKTTPSVADSNGNGIVDEEEARDQQYTCVEVSYDEALEEEEASEQQYAESHCTDTAIEAEASEQYYYEEPSYDWITNISRPRSYWEDRRRAWYREMLETGSDNEEICQLLQRRTVSTFLSSDFRERMDRLMESHMGTQTHLITSQEDEDDSRGRIEQLIQFLQEHKEEEDDDEKIEAEEGREEEEENERGIVEEEQGEEEEKLEEEGSLISSQYHEVGNYFNQPSSSMHTASPSTTWSYRDNETVDDSDIVTSTSSPQPSQSQSFYRDGRQYSSSANHHSIEMELIYDLRGNMEQLYQEMAELRKSIKSCIDMQMMLQQSMAREVHTVKEELKTPNRKPKKGNCCICYEMKVDSLLYRCGHMCACLKCANELQWNSGKCPICRAPIVDVVRVYVDA